MRQEELKWFGGRVSRVSVDVYHAECLQQRGLIIVAGGAVT